MARPARIEYRGAFYHVMNRGNQKGNIFLDDNDREKFLKILGNVEQRYGIVIYIFVLMSNHYHILIETPIPNLSRAIQRLNGDYALYFSRKYKKPGHLFQGRFKAMLVEKEEYLLVLSRYIHLNPYRAGLTESIKEYKWSSLPYYLNGKAVLPFSLSWEWILTRFDSRKRVAIKEYLEYIHGGIKDIENPGLEARGGWILGNEDWVKDIIEKGLSKIKSKGREELIGVKQLKPKISVTKFEEVVCEEFQVEKEELKARKYNNIARMAIIYLAVHHCGFSLKKAAARYNAVSYFSISKSSSRFESLLLKDSKLNKKIKRIVSKSKM